MVVPKALLLSGATARVSGYGTDKLLQTQPGDRIGARRRDHHRPRSRHQRRRRALRRRADLRRSVARRVGRGRAAGRQTDDRSDSGDRAPRSRASPGRGADLHDVDGALEPLRRTAEPVHLRDLPLRRLRRRAHPSHRPRRRSCRHQTAARAVQQPPSLLARARSRSRLGGVQRVSRGQRTQRPRPVVRPARARRALARGAGRRRRSAFTRAPSRSVHAFPDGVQSPPQPGGAGTKRLLRRRARRRARVPRPLRVLPRGAPGQRRRRLARAVRTLGVAGDDPRRADRLGQGRVQPERRRALRPPGGSAHPVVAPPLQEAALLHQRLGEGSVVGARPRALRRRRVLARDGKSRTDSRRPRRTGLDAREKKALLAFLDLL